MSCINASKELSPFQTREDNPGKFKNLDLNLKCSRSERVGNKYFKCLREVKDNMVYMDVNLIVLCR